MTPQPWPVSFHAERPAPLSAPVNSLLCVKVCAVPEQWVVDCKHVGTGEKALVYLGRYLYRGVIQEKDILRCDNGQVSFRKRDAKTGKTMMRTVSGAPFLWLLMQPVLPRGFRRARNFGFPHPPTAWGSWPSAY